MRASSWGLLPSWSDFNPRAVPQAKPSAGVLVLEVQILLHYLIFLVCFRLEDVTLLLTFMPRLPELIS